MNWQTGSKLSNLRGPAYRLISQDRGNIHSLMKLLCMLQLMLLCAQQITGQTIEFCGVFPPHQASGTNPDSIVYDRFGNSYDLHELALSGSSGSRSICGHYILDVYGVDPSLIGTICQVFEDLSDLIDVRYNESGCGDIALSAPVAIALLYDLNLSADVLAAASPLYYIVSQLACDAVRLSSIYLKLNGGLASNTSIDGRLALNPSFENWHTDLNTTPGANDIDLYSVILHEALHILGFASRMLDDGTAASGFFSLWDQLLNTTTYYDPEGDSSDLTPLLTGDCAQSCWELNNTTFPELSDFIEASENSCDLVSGLDFVVGPGLAPLTSGVPGPKVLSHLDPYCNEQDADYVMQSTIPAGPSSVRRQITTAEKEILCLIGYKMADCNNCFATASEKFVTLTQTWYNPPCCDPVFKVCSGETFMLEYDRVLCNDYTNTDELEITHCQASSGMSASLTGNEFTLYSTTPGRYTVTYTIKGCDCRLASATFEVFVMPCFDCETIDPCENLICVNGFEQFPNTAGNTYFPGLIMELSDAAYWTFSGNIENSPDICQEGSSNKYLHFVGNDIIHEGISLKLSEPILPGCTMTIRLDAASKDNASSLVIHGSEFPPCNFIHNRISLDCLPTICDGYVYTPICIDEIEISNTFTGGGPCLANAGLQTQSEILWTNNLQLNTPIYYITIFPQRSQSQSQSQFFIDNIVITTSCLDPSFSYIYVEECKSVEFTPNQTDGVIEHHWDFGDTNDSDEEDPVHIYDAPGMYIATHTVTDACGNTSSTTLQVLIENTTGDCCIDVVINSSTTWHAGNLPNSGRFQTVTVKRGYSLVIEEDAILRFCQDGALIIEAGAFADISGKLLSYGQMTWLGIFVEGDPALSQQTDPYSSGFNGLQQGRLVTRYGAAIRNARIAIRNYGPDGDATTGGMVTSEGTIFQNNTVAIDFGPYQNFDSFSGQPRPSLGSFTGCTFITNSGYFISDQFYAFVSLRGADGMRFTACSFQNNKLPVNPSAISDFGIGIYSVSSGFGVFASHAGSASMPCEHPCVVASPTTFTGLGHAIYVLTKDRTQPYSIFNAEFDNCFRNITSINTTGGTILFNKINMGDVPDTDFTYGQIGVELHFDHNGFVLQENTFELVDDESDVVPIGILTNALGGFDNEIRRNTFIGIETANQAFGVSADITFDIERGLTYFCNTCEDTPAHGYDFHIPDSYWSDLIHPFQTPGSIDGFNISAGNEFAYTAHDVMNYGGGDISYWYYPLGQNEEPRDDPFSLGITDFQGLDNTCAIEYCAPSCIGNIADIKDDYTDYISLYGDYLEDYLDAVDLEDQAEIDTTRSKALYYRKAASRAAYDVVTHIMIDTLTYHLDTLISWMGHLDTYGAELMIAGEYAYRGDYTSALDVLETISLRRLLTPAQEMDIDRMTGIYTLLDTTEIDSLTTLDRSWLRYIAYTNDGMSSGVARAVLAHFREYIPLPYYAGPQIKFRSDDDEHDDENKFTFDQAHLKIYPNPASDRIHVEWDGDLYQPYRIDVINANGLRIESLDEIFGQSVTFEATDWPNGIYLIVSNDGSGQMQTGKVLILKN